MSTKNIHRIIAVLRLVAHLPLGVLYLISDFGYVLVYYIIRYRREVVRKNLVNSFPEKSLKEIISIEKKFYHSLCDTSIESFKTLHISDKEMRRRVDVQGTELVEAAAAEGKSVIALLGHCGCWEWVQEVTVRYKAPRISGEIYKHITSPFVQEVMNAIRSRWDTLLIEKDQAMRTLLRLNREKEPFLMGFISDQRAYSNLRRWTVFMHQYADYLSGGEELARHIGAKILYIEVVRTKRGHYRLTFTDIVPEDLSGEAPYTIQFYKMLEETIRKQPEIWLWSHNRWKKSEVYANQVAPSLPEEKRLKLD